MNESAALKTEKVLITVDTDDPSPAELKGYFLEVFDSIDAAPRKLFASVVTENDRDAAASVDFEDGEPVFRVEGRRPFKGNFSKRWIPDHPVPLRFRRRGATKLVFEPAEGDRIRVRRPTLLERIFA